MPDLEYFGGTNNTMCVLHTYYKHAFNSNGLVVYSN